LARDNGSIVSSWMTAAVAAVRGLRGEPIGRRPAVVLRDRT
jgi:hypothetical protein